MLRNNKFIQKKPLIVNAGKSRSKILILAGDSVAAGFICERLKKQKIGFVNGCFDILHAGHVAMLNMARSQCDKLIVGVSSDAVVERCKGKGRPILKDEERAYIISSLAAVDMTIIIFDDTPLNVLKKLKPELVVKGKDYELAEYPERKFLESSGITVVYAPILNSSKQLIEKCKKVGKSTLRKSESK